MKKISQAIIAATLILDVAVIFTFGLAVISSFEDGSRLPEGNFVRQPAKGRVAGEATSTCPTYSNLMIYSPSEGTSINTGNFRISVRATGSSGVTTSTLMYVVYPIRVAPFYVKIPATQQVIMGHESYPFPYNTEWIVDINLIGTQIQSGPFTFHAEANNSNIDACIAKSADRNIVINFTPPAPAVNITPPASGSPLSGSQATITGEIVNLPAGTQIQEALIKIFNNATQVAGPFPAPALNANNYLTRQSIFNSTALNGAYDVKMFVHYMGTDGVLKFIESAPITVNFDNTSTASTNTSNNQNANSGANTNSGPNYNSNISNANTSTTNINTSTSTSGTNTNSAASANNNASTDTATATVNSVAIISPAAAAILRARDNHLYAKTLIAASGLQFKIHKSDEPVDWFRMIDALSSDKINWIANWSLIDFKNGIYDITALTPDIKSQTIQVVVQKFGFSWINPQPLQKLSADVSIKARIDGIYEKDGITPVKGVKVYFYQTNTQSPYSEIYNEQLYQDPGTPEWRLYDWTLKREKLWKTSNSNPGKYRLIIKVINESISASNVWTPTEPIFIEINNQQAVLPSNNNINASISSGNSNQNKNANINTAATNTAASNSSNTSSAQNANTANNTNTNAAKNVNAATDSAVAPAQIDSDQDLLSDEKERILSTDPNSADTDNDGLTDFVEVDKYKTDPLKNDTDGDGYMDGEEVQSLHDPLKPPTDPTAAVLVKPKPIEEPKTSGVITKDILAVENVYTPKKVPEKTVSDDVSPVTGGANTNINKPEQPPSENTIILKGKGPANTVLTLFIYSNDPIVVTVRTNENGEWIYELDKSLDDGEHEVYATITDDTGKIESKSSPMRFLVKQAVAETIPERADTAAKDVPGSSSTNAYILISGIMVLVAIFVGFAITFRKKHNNI